MCGIVGVLGQARMSPRGIVEALRRLEYRGYDSGGRRDGRQAGIRRRGGAR